MINTQHVQEVLDFIEAHPEQHNQGNWVIEHSCGTTMCVAGTSIMLTQGMEALVNSCFEGSYSGTARKNMGLTLSQSNKLFYTMNEGYAKDMLKALANNDKKKFNEIHATYEKEIGDETF